MTNTVTNTIRMEAERIRTLPAVWYLALLAVALGVVAAAFVASTLPRGTLPVEPSRAVVSGGSSGSILPFVGLPMLFLGVVAVLEETRHKLATVLLVAQPWRTTLMLARLTVLTAVAVPVGLAQMVACSVTALALGRIPQFGEVLQVAAVHLLAVVLFTWVGAALGWLTGAASVAVGAVLLEMLLLEPLVKVAGVEYSDSIEGWAKYLPFTAARDALALKPLAMIVSTGFALALLLGAWLRVRTRDY